LVEEGDDLSGTCGGEDFAEREETESEQRPRAAAVFLDGNGMQARHGDTGFHRQRHGEGHEREQGAQFVRVGEVRGLQSEALGLEISEHGFDRLALTITGERVTRSAGTGQGQQLAGREPHHHEPHGRRQSLILAAERLWVILSLGSHWTTRIIVMPGAPLVSRIAVPTG
jgi:hypothetical protein